MSKHRNNDERLLDIYDNSTFCETNAPFRYPSAWERFTQHRYPCECILRIPPPTKVHSTPSKWVCDQLMDGNQVLRLSNPPQAGLIFQVLNPLVLPPIRMSSSYPSCFRLPKQHHPRLAGSRSNLREPNRYALERGKDLQTVSALAPGGQPRQATGRAQILWVLYPFRGI